MRRDVLEEDGTEGSMKLLRKREVESCVFPRASVKLEVAN